MLLPQILRIYQWIAKNVFSIAKSEFEPIMNSAHTADLLALGKTLNKNINYLMYYQSRQHVKWKHFKCKFAFNNNFMNKEQNLRKCERF